MRRTAIVAFGISFALIGALAGCGGGGSSATPVTTPAVQATPTPTPAPTSASQPLSPSSGTIALPSAGGFGGDLTLPANNAPSGTSISLTSLTGAPAGGPVPQAARRSGQSVRTQAQSCTGTPTVLFSLEIAVSQTVTFNGFPSFSITLPASVSTAGETFDIALFGGTTTQATLLATLGPATIAGQTLTFSGTTQQLTLTAGQTYVAELYDTSTTACASPSPSPTPTAAPTATPTPTPSAAPAAGTLYVLLPGSGTTYTVEAFAPGASGAATPVSSFSTSISNYVSGIAVDATGRVYIAAAPDILSYAYGASGAVTPSTTLTTDAAPWGLSIDAGGDLVATDDNPTAADFFAAGATGAAAPTKQIAGANTQMNLPYQVAFDGSGNIYVLNANAPSVTVYPTGSVGNAAPSAVISGNSTGLDGPEALAVDSTGRIYVGNSQNNTITVYAPGASGNATPVATLQGSTYNFSIDQAVMALDASNDLYVTGDSSNQVVVFGPVTAANPTPLRTITGLSGVNGVAVVP